MKRNMKKRITPSQQLTQWTSQRIKQKSSSLNINKSTNKIPRLKLYQRTQILQGTKSHTLINEEPRTYNFQNKLKKKHCKKMNSKKFQEKYEKKIEKVKEGKFKKISSQTSIHANIFSQDRNSFGCPELVQEENEQKSRNMSIAKQFDLLCHQVEPEKLKYQVELYKKECQFLTQQLQHTLSVIKQLKNELEIVNGMKEDIVEVKGETLSPASPPTSFHFCTNEKSERKTISFPKLNTFCQNKCKNNCQCLSSRAKFTSS